MIGLEKAETNDYEHFAFLKTEVAVTFFFLLIDLQSPYLSSTPHQGSITLLILLYILDLITV